MNTDINMNEEWKKGIRGLRQIQRAGASIQQLEHYKVKFMDRMGLLRLSGLITFAELMELERGVLEIEMKMKMEMEMEMIEK